jgi:hypothetical protein
LVVSAKTDEKVIAESDATVTETDLETLNALAEVLYPSSVEVTRGFIETSVLGRHIVDDSYLTGVREALSVVRTTSKRETGRKYAALDVGIRDDVLRETGASRAYADPEGTVAQRVRYYVVNGLLYALYATPKGAGLVGNENPMGYPGGTEVYQRPPPRR